MCGEGARRPPPSDRCGDACGDRCCFRRDRNVNSHLSPKESTTVSRHRGRRFANDPALPSTCASRHGEEVRAPAGWRSRRSTRRAGGNGAADSRCNAELARVSEGGDLFTPLPNGPEDAPAPARRGEARRQVTFQPDAADYKEEEQEPRDDGAGDEDRR